MKTDSSIVRGCLANLPRIDAEICKSNADSCKTCFDSACNGRTTFANCTIGSSTLDTKPQQLKSKICENYNDKCFVHMIEGVIRRGCLKEYVAKNKLPFSYLKRSFNSSLYRTCSTPLCNDDEIQSEFCVSCDSKDDLNCRLNITASMRKKCSYSEKSMGCYHYIEDDRVLRGCVADADEEQRKICEQDSDICKTCFGRECNSKLSFQRCLSNNYTAPGSNETVYESKICTDYSDECYTHVRDNFVRRGCMSSISAAPTDNVDVIADCENEDICEKCSGTNNCNNKEIRKEFCISCDTKSLQECESSPRDDLSQQCAYAVKPLGCFLYKDENRFVKRGCLANESLDGRKMCREEGEKCKTCNIDRNCNLKPSFQVCHECNSNDDQANCIQKPWYTPEITCKNYSDECYTHVENGIVSRGCIGDHVIPMADNCSNPEVCKRCATHNCNEDEIKIESCIVCNSITDPTCASNSTFSTLEECPIAVSQLGCFHSIDDKTGVVKRGCMSSLPVTERNICRHNGQSCKTCEGAGCNEKKAFEACFSCNSLTDPDCISNHGVVETKVCRLYDDEVMLLINLYI